MAAEKKPYTMAELMVTAAAREIADGEVVFVGMRLPRRSVMDESLLGSHPIIVTRYPSSAHAAATLEAVLDFPIPPLPYIAICLGICSILLVFNQIIYYLRINADTS